MVSMYKWHQIRVMKEKGEGIKRIARELGISKNTVRKYLKSNAPPEFKEREYKKKVDPYVEAVNKMLGLGYIGTRIFAEIKESGYLGSLASVHRYIREHKSGEDRANAATTRFETPPGHQMQYDWKEWMLPVGGKEIKIYLHEVILCYSRFKHYSFSLSIKGQDVMRAIETAVEFFGGRAQELVIDNPKQMIVTHRQDGIVHYNEEFLKFCGLYGIEPRACRNYRARTKGKVERPFYYIQEHLLRGLSIECLGEFDEKLSEFTRAYNQRPHSTLGESPEERLSREKQALKPVPAVEPTVLYEREIRRVSNDGYISYRGKFYPVPMRLCLQDVWVECVFGRKIRVYEKGGTLISDIEIRHDAEILRPEHPEHAIINQKYQAKRERIRSAIVEKFISMFDATGELYVSLLRETVSTNLYWHLSEILSCCDVYEPAEVKRALDASIEIGSFHKNSILRLLDPAKLRCPVQDRHLSQPVCHGEVVTRPLSVYAGIGEEVAHG